MLESKGHVAVGVMSTLVACAATCGLGIAWAQTAANGHVWAHDPTTVKVCIATVQGSYYH